MKIKRLTKAAIANLPDGMHNDGNGLYLRVRGDSKDWILRFRWNYKRHDLGLGPLSLVPLADARAKADRIRVGIKDGQHPILLKQEKHLAKVTEQNLAKGASTFLSSFYKEAIDEYVATRKPRRKTFAREARSFCEMHIFPTLDMPVANITKEAISQTLLPMWNTYKGSLALQHLRMLLRYALRHGYVKEPLPTTWEGGLDAYLPPNKNRSVKHHAFIPWKEVPDFFAKIAAHDCNAARYVGFVILTACRRSEAANAKVSEFDLQARTFTLPMNKTSRVPVTFPYPEQAVALLRVSPGQEYMFENDLSKRSRHINDRTIDKWLRSLGYTATMHGFRSSFSTWCADNGKDYEVREKVLTHVGGAVVESYQRSKLLERRRALLQEWADFVCSKVTQ